MAVPSRYSPTPRLALIVVLEGLEGFLNSYVRERVYSIARSSLEEPFCLRGVLSSAPSRVPQQMVCVIAEISRDRRGPPMRFFDYCDREGNSIVLYG